MEFLLPVVRDGLKKAVVKRTVEDIEFTLELKHALRRYFSEVLSLKKDLKLY